ncbi:MAG: hypothetical protein AB7O59_23780 [Pirellulales bacterium]
MKVRSSLNRVLLCVAIFGTVRDAMAQGPGAGLPCSCTVGCPTGPHVGCAPRRITYGYYPTQWRRWPDAHLMGAPTPAEQAPTPAGELPPPGGEDAGPRVEPEQTPGALEGTLPPSTEPGIPGGEPRIEPETESPGTQPRVEPEPGLPFGDEPPAPPSDTPPGNLPGTPGLPGTTPSGPVPGLPGLPGLEPQIQAPPADDAPPVMPDEDPFKDDPIEQSPSGPAATDPAAPTSSDNRDDPPAPLAEAPEDSPAGWRGTPRLKVVDQSAAVIVPEPKLLPTEPAREEPSRELSAAKPEPVATESVALNPLRGSRPARQPTRVVTAATWSTDQPAAVTPHLQTRRNPLR